MMYGSGSYGSLEYGSRRGPVIVTETTTVSGTPSVILKTASQTAILTTRDEGVILPTNQAQEATLL